MSWLFDDTKVYVDVLTNKLTDSKHTPIKSGILTAVQRDTGVGDSIIAGMINGLSPRGRRFYNYADRPGSLNPIATAEIGIEYNDVAGLMLGTYSPFPGTFYPIVNIRKDNVFLTLASDEPRYIQTRSLLKRVTLKLSDLTGSLEEDHVDENGDPIPGNPVADLNDVFFLFGIDLYAKHSESASYMYDFWEHIKNDVQLDDTDLATNIALFLNESLPTPVNHIPTNSIRISEPAGDYEIRIQFDYMVHIESTGILTEPYSGDSKEEDYIVATPGTITTYTKDLGQGGDTVSIRVDSSYMTCHKQIRRTIWGDADDAYASWFIYGITHETIVAAYGENISVFRTILDNEGLPGYNTGTYSDNYLLRPGDAAFGRSGFYFPLCKEVLETYKTIPEEEILVDGMQMIMHAAQEVDLEWYQQRWFKILMAAIVMFVIYISIGQLAELALSMYELALHAAIGIAIAYVTDLLVQNISGDLGILLAIVASVALSYYGRNLFGNTSLPTAKQLLFATKAIIRSGMTAIEHYQDELYDEIADFLEEKEDREEELAAAQALLPQNKYNPLWLVENHKRLAPFESPSAFYSRTLNTNPGVEALTAIDTFAERALELPKYDPQQIDPKYAFKEGLA